jgi:LacI family transcriptional regulator
MVPKVVILIESSRAWGRGLIRGIAKYSQLHGPWNFLKPPVFFIAGSNRRFLDEIKKFNPDGIIMREVPDTEKIIALGKPVVISPHLHEKFAGAFNITEDFRATGQMAAEYLISKGLKNFAFCGLDDMFWSHRRAAGFQDRAKQNGHPVSIYKQPKKKNDRIRVNEIPLLKEWLHSLPKPVGLMCCIDERSDLIAEICKAEGIHVPEDIAIIGVDNDDLICELSSPPLTSISFNCEGLGYQAASMLEKLMTGQKLSDTEGLIASPANVVERQSTEIRKISDPDVAKAISYINEKSNSMIYVEDVVSKAAVPRRTLERRFHAFLGNSIYQTIQNERTKRIEHLLIATNMSVSEIAYSMGFSNPNELTRSFQKNRKMSPTAFRKKYKFGLLP